MTAAPDTPIKVKATKASMIAWLGLLAVDPCAEADGMRLTEAGLDTGAEAAAAADGKAPEVARTEEEATAAREAVCGRVGAEAREAAAAGSLLLAGNSASTVEVSGIERSTRPLSKGAASGVFT